MMNVSDISESLGIKLSTEFITDTLGVEPDGKDKRATLFEVAKFEEIKQALIQHIDRCEPTKAPKREAKSKAASPSTSGGASDEDEY